MSEPYPQPMKRILIIGARGQLGTALRRRAPSDWEVHATSRTPPEGWHALDLSRPHHLDPILEAVDPDVVVNVAYTPGGSDLDAITGCAPGELAARCVDRRFVHLSSDVVFDGRMVGPVDESWPTSPVHAYGEAKLASEQAVRVAHPNPLIVRTSLLWGVRDGVVERQVRDPGFVFYEDEVRCPTHVDDLADALYRWIPTGHRDVLHLAGCEPLGRAAFARMLAPSLGVERIASRPSPRVVPRPRHLHLASVWAEPLPGPSERLQS